jgi:hypothetical protein
LRRIYGREGEIDWNLGPKPVKKVEEKAIAEKIEEKTIVEKIGDETEAKTVVTVTGDDKDVSK